MRSPCSIRSTQAVSYTHLVLNGINGVKHITSQSKENVSVVTLELREGLDIENAINDTRDKISAITEARCV